MSHPQNRGGSFFFGMVKMQSILQKLSKTFRKIEIIVFFYTLPMLADAGAHLRLILASPMLITSILAMLILIDATLLYRGSERLLRDDVLCLPCESFLRALHPDKMPEF